MKKTPKVTIVTATYNLIKNDREAFFRQCVESVHNQTYPNIEHLIIDGASTDGTLDLIKEYEEKGWLKYYSEPDAGMVDAMNKGIKKASGEYVAILNSDDYYAQDAIELLMSKLLDEKADYSYGNTNMYSRSGDKKLWEWKPTEELFSKFYIYLPFNHEAMLCKKTTYQSLNYYDFSKYGTAADYDFVIKLILNDFKGCYVDQVILNFRMDGTTNHTSEKKSPEYLKHMHSFYQVFLDLWEKFLPSHYMNELNTIVKNRNTELSKTEIDYILNVYFYKKLLKFLKRKKLKNYPFKYLTKTIKNFEKSIRIVLFNFFPLLKIKIVEDKYYFKLFNCIPLVKIKIKKNVKAFYLFYCISFLKIKF